MTIKATIIQDSYANDVRITTFELEYPRFIHSELMTHRLFSRNAASSRAVPIEKMLEHITNSPAEPVHWGANQSGMSAKEELAGQALIDVKAWWHAAKDSAVEWSRILAGKGLHKQIANRITEPFQVMKTIVTATEFDNWFDLREHEDAQPEIHALATAMREAMEESEHLHLVILLPGEWHVPYVERRSDAYSMHYFDNNGQEFTAEEARMVSASCCAQVSYRKSDDSLEKARLVYDRLVGSVPRHSSPFEHQATPMEQTTIDWADTGWKSWDDGVTHVDSEGSFWSGNFRGWIQNRQLIDQEY